MTLNQKRILDSIEVNQDRTFIIEGETGEDLTYGQFHGSALWFAGLLRERGIGMGDKVLICLNNSREFAAIYFACLYTGAVAVPLNTNLNRREMEHITARVRAGIFIYSSETEPAFSGTKVPESVPLRLCLFTARERARGEKPAEGALDTSAMDGGSPDIAPFEDVSEDAMFLVMHTSGTTEYPKGVAHSIASMSGNALAFIDIHSIGRDDRFYNILSMAYMAGFYNLLLLPLLAGASVVVGSAFKPSDILNFWETPMKYGVNVLWLVPTIMSMMLNLDRDERGTGYCRDKVRLVLSGTAPLAVSARKEFEEKYGKGVFENYGLSETLFISTVSAHTGVVDASVGSVLPGCELLVLGPDGGELPRGQEGELAFRGPGVMLGYLDEGGRPSGVHVPFLTGDIGYLSGRGMLFITGRKKDVIIKGGRNLSPAALENVLMEQGSIDMAAAIGVPHPVYGEDVVAVVKLKGGQSFDIVHSALQKYCAASLDPSEVPSQIFEIEEFPLSSTGKVDKNRLRKLVEGKTRQGLS